MWTDNVRAEVLAIFAEAQRRGYAEQLAAWFARGSQSHNGLVAASTSPYGPSDGETCSRGHLWKLSAYTDKAGTRRCLVCRAGKKRAKPKQEKTVKADLNPCAYAGCERKKARGRGVRYCHQHSEEMKKLWTRNDNQRRRQSAEYRAWEKEQRAARRRRKRTPMPR